MPIEAIEIRLLTLAELRADESGKAIEQLAGLLIEAFSEPPWNENFSAPRIHFGLGVELMRPHALLYVARLKDTKTIAGYILGKELVQNSSDDRNQTVFDISGTTALDHLFEGGKRLFYVSGLAVGKKFRRGGLAERLSRTLNEDLRNQGFVYRLGRTDLSLQSMRNLYTKLGFSELPVNDGRHPNRSYWILKL